jgi:hypothetical protein
MSFQSPIKVRGGGYGLDAELANKAAAKYDYDLEDEAREWIETITSMKIGENFGEGLRNGVILCELANKIHPGIIKRIETKSKMPFKLMENVSSFLKACRVIGVNEFDLFETVDLFELKDLGLVVRCLHALGRAVQKNYPKFIGPTLGVKESSKNERTFTQAQLNQSRAAVSMLNMGSSSVMERPEISMAASVTFGADATQSPIKSLARAPPPPPPLSNDKVQQISFEVSEFVEHPVVAPKVNDVPNASPVPSSNIEELKESITQVSLSSSDPTPARQNESAKEQKSPSNMSDGDEAKAEAQEWIEAIVGEKFLSNFGDSLKDGVILCNLMNIIKPGSVKKVEHSQMPFKQMENVSNFLKACRTVGVAEFDLFETVDLFELKNIGLVVKCLHALGRAIQKNCPDYTGPTLGVKESTVNKRTFSTKQIMEANAAVPILTKATSSVMERHHSSSGLNTAHQKLEEPKPVSDPVPHAENLSDSSAARRMSGAAAVAQAISRGSGTLPTRTVWS